MLSRLNKDKLATKKGEINVNRPNKRRAVTAAVICNLHWRGAAVSLNPAVTVEQQNSLLDGIRGCTTW